MPPGNRLLIHVLAQLKPAQCGVSDFAIALAQELDARFGIQSAFAVVNSTVPCDLPFPKAYCEQPQLLDLCNSLSGGQPGTILVHLSGYGFSRDGAPAVLAQALARVGESGRYRIAVYFHELFARGMPWTSAFWYSSRQKRAVRSIAAECDLLATSSCLYANWLSRNRGSRSSLPIQVLPVFSNAGEPQVRIVMESRSPAVAVFGLPGTRRRSYRQLATVAKLLHRLGVEEIVDIGPAFDAPAELCGLPVKRVGVLAAPDLESLLSHTRFGFVPHPPLYLAKSGIFAGFCANGVVPLLAGSFAGAVDGLTDGVHLVSPGTAQAALAAGLDGCSAAAWLWYSGHRLQVHAAAYADWLNRLPTGD